jgi:RNA polymerase sigma-70 factor (ECF subfamily)
MEAMTRAFDHVLARTLASAVQGDDVAFARIVAAHHAEMFSICVLVCRDRTMAEEAVHSAWAIAWRKIGSVRESARLRPWLVSIAVNESKQLLRKRWKRSRVEFVSDATDAPGGIDPATGVDAIDLRAAMERLDPDDRALLALRYIAGFNATELSAALGISPSGVRNRLERLTARLRQELSDG